MSTPKTDYHIVDNFLPMEYFMQLKQHIESNDMPWFFMNGVANEYDNSDSYFTHTFFKNNGMQSQLFSMLEPIIGQLECKALIRARANLYPSKKEFIEHGQHADFPYDHKTLIYSVNKNNGFTRLDDGTKIESVENRALFFNGGKLHNSTTCTDTSHRINIAISYF